MDLTIIEKATYYVNYLYNNYYLKLYPYKNVIIDNSPMDSDYKRMNYIHWGYKMSLNFTESKRVVLNYSDNIKFNTVFYANSHNEINRKVNKLLENNLNKKIKYKFPNIIVNIVFTLEDTLDTIDILDIVNNSVEFENNIITFNDILFLCNSSAKNIKSINVSFVKKMKTLKKEFNFSEYKHKDIEVLNTIFD